jgi:hypothetical protein
MTRPSIEAAKPEPIKTIIERVMNSLLKNKKMAGVLWTASWKPRPSRPVSFLSRGIHGKLFFGICLEIS